MGGWKKLDENRLMGIEIWRSGARVLPYCSVAIPLLSQASLHRMIIKRHSPRDWSCIKPLWTQRRCPTCATSWVLLGWREITFNFHNWRKTRILLISIFHRLTDSIAEVNRADGQCILWRQTLLKNIIKTKDFMIFLLLKYCMTYAYEDFSKRCT